MMIAERLARAGRRRARARPARAGRTRRSARRSPRAACSVEELEAADLVVLCVDHAELPYDDIVDHARLVLDTRGRLRGLGFRGESL